MGRIDWKCSLLATLLDRWDVVTCTFYLSTREMTIIVEDIHRLYRLPIHGQRILHVVDRAGALIVISYLYGATRVDTIMSEIISGGI